MFRRRVPRPHPALLLLDGRQIEGFLARSVPNAGFALVDWGRLTRAGTRSYAMYVSSRNATTASPGHEGFCDISRRALLGERTKCRHEGVALLPALSLEHLMVSPSMVCADIATGRAVDLAGKGQDRLELGS